MAHGEALSRERAKTSYGFKQSGFLDGRQKDACTGAALVFRETKQLFLAVDVVDVQGLFFACLSAVK
jgi:hypothetical protein